MLNSVLNLNQATTGGISAQGSTVTLDGAQVNANSRTNLALTLTESAGVVRNSTLTNTNGVGLLLTHSLSGTTGATAAVSNSTITGTANGAGVFGYSTLTLDQGSQVFSTATGSAALIVRAGTAQVTDSLLHGAQNGVIFGTDITLTDGQVTLDGSDVVGVTGAAIRVQEGASATLDISNKSTLTGGNGNALEVDQGSTANVTTQNVGLEGNVLITQGSNAAIELGANSSLAGDLTTRGNSNVSLVLSQASLSGNIINEVGSTSAVVLQDQSVFKGTTQNVSSLAVNNDAQWVLTGDSSVTAMSFGGGTVALGAENQFYTLSLGSLQGNGTFALSADFSQLKNSYLDISGRADGDFGLLINASGADPVDGTSLHVVHAGGGNAQFSLVGGAVDLGTWSYALTQVRNDWYLDVSSRTISPGTQSVLALFNTAPTVFYGELTSLRSRMGELRLTDAQAGGWIRTYGNKYDVSEASGVGYQQYQQGFSLGADAPLPWGDGQWLMGVMAGYSRSDLDLARGTSGTVDSYYAGLYTTWLDRNSGYYFDAVLKANRFANRSDVNLSDGTQTKGKYDTAGLGGSVEFGRQFKLADGYFIEPFGQLSAVVIQGRNYDLDNGMAADGDRTRSVLGKLGSTAGRNFDLGNGRTLQPYVKAALVHEFAKNNEVQVNNNVFNNDLSGSRGELGVGMAIAWSERLQVHADFDYSNGEKIEQPWGANVGLRFNF